MQEPTDPPVREALGFAAMFRALGYSAEAIHFFEGEDSLEGSGRCLFVKLVWGGKEFIATVGNADDTTTARLYDAMLWWNEVPPQEVQNRIRLGSRAFQNAPVVLLALLRKGFPTRIPGAK